MSFFSCSKDAFLFRETFPSKPPPHTLRTDIHRRELKHAISEAAVPAGVRPVKEEGEDAVAHCAVEGAGEVAVHSHHEGDEGVDAEDDAEERGGNHTHEFEIGFSD